MAPPPPRPPPSDLSIGLGYYATRTPSVSARIKSDAADFEVQEISLYPLPDPDGPFCVLRVRSRDWEQHELAREIARRLHLPPHALSWSGTKDRRAISERLFSYRGAPPAGPIDLPRTEVIDAYQARSGLVLGHHFGNAFRIRLRGLVPSLQSVRTQFALTQAELGENVGFPNFFGPQRFGEVRPVTHQVGRELVRGDVASAVDLYLCAPTVGESGLGSDARAAYAASHDPVRALRDFPPGFRFERLLLDHLAQGHPPERALRALSRELRLLFVHAYQSLLFNRWLTLRHERKIPIREPVEGDFLLRARVDGTMPGTDAIPVGSDNLGECRTLVERAGARVAGPLVGYSTPQSEGAAGELLEELLGAEGINRDAFRLPKTPEISSQGSFRPALVPLPPMGIRSIEAEEGIELSFALPKGTYATVLLREFLKTGAATSGA